MGQPSHQLHYLELSNDPIRFDSVSQLTNVFFDDTNRQVFAVRSGGTTGIVVKGPTEATSMSFCMENKGLIRSIKFSPDNRVLAIQRLDATVEFIGFTGPPNQSVTGDVIVYKGKSATNVFGFVWLHAREVAIITNAGIELYFVNFERKQLKSSKSINFTINWFSWCPAGHFTCLASSGRTILTPVILKPGTITKLPKLEWDVGDNPTRTVPERDVTLAQIYGTSAILILQPTSNGLVEVVVYLLNGPGLSPKKSHVLRLGYGGRFAINIVDNLVIVHHQASETSLIFDTGLSGEVEPLSGVESHGPVTPGRSLKPATLRIPSISLDQQTIECELYSPNWVLFQPNIVIDAKLGCLWYVHLKMQPMCLLITDRVRLVEFLLQRTEGKSALIDVLQQMTRSGYDGTVLPVLESIFHKLNTVYSEYVTAEVNSQTAQPLFKIKPVAKVTSFQSNGPRVLIDQSDMFTHIFQPIADTDYVGKLLLIYLHSLVKSNISAQHDLSKMIIGDLVRRGHFDTLQQLVEFSMLTESKPIACYLLSLSKSNPQVTQIALDMLAKLNAYELIVEVLLGQRRVVDALRVAKQHLDVEKLSARKYLEAAQKTKDDVVFYTVYTFFQRQKDFAKSEQCSDYIQHFERLFL